MITKMGARAAVLIKAAIEKRGLSGPEIAQAIGCGSQSIYHWRDGLYIPSRWAIPGLAKVLKISERKLRDAVDLDRSERRHERASGAHPIITDPEPTEPGPGGES